MKANQAFRNADEAVSPVIGVILMVAITVVLAAVVFVLVSNLSKGGQQSAPNLAINVDDTADRLVIVSASSGADWSRLTVVATTCTGTVVNVGGASTTHNNLAATSAAKTAVSAGTNCAGPNVPVQIAPSSSLINAGDFLSFCTTTTADTNVIVSIVDTVANSQVGSYTFTTIAFCA